MYVCIQIGGVPLKNHLDRCATFSFWKLMRSTRKNQGKSVVECSKNCKKKKMSECTTL